MKLKSANCSVGEHQKCDGPATLHCDCDCHHQWKPHGQYHPADTAPVTHLFETLRNAKCGARGESVTTSLEHVTCLVCLQAVAPHIGKLVSAYADAMQEATRFRTIATDNDKRAALHWGDALRFKRELDALKEVGTYQQRVYVWTLETFGIDVAHDKQERNHRFLEEALELVQALGCTKEECLSLMAYVYSRPEGEPMQELGGVMVTLATVANAHGIDQMYCAETELRRCWDTQAKIREKHAAKPKFSTLPGPAYAPDEQVRESANRMIRKHRTSMESMTDSLHQFSATPVADDDDTCPRCGGSFTATGGKPVGPGPYQCQKCAAEEWASVHS